MPNFHDFLVIKENAELAGYFLLLSLPHSPLPRGKFLLPSLTL